MKKLAQKLPKPAQQLVRAVYRAPSRLAMSLGRIGSSAPLSKVWGSDRGTPIDRHYIEGFLTRHASDVRGHVLEVQGDDYSRRLGGNRITRQEILNLDEANPRATIVGDLAHPATLPADHFDCIILTQTLHLVFDMAAAVANIHRALRPEGVLLVTVPGISPLDHELRDSWYWSVTDLALQRLLSGPFDAKDVSVSAYGNLYAATAFLHAAAVQEVSRRKLDRFDRVYPVTIAARATKRAPAPLPR